MHIQGVHYNLLNNDNHLHYHNHFSYSHAFQVMQLYMYTKDDWMSWNNVHVRYTKTYDTVDKWFSVMKVILITLCIMCIIIKNNYCNQQMHKND